MELIHVKPEEKENNIIYALNREITALESNKKYLIESKARLRQRIKALQSFENKYINQLHSQIVNLKSMLRSERVVSEILREDLRELPFFKKLKILFFR